MTQASDAGPSRTDAAHTGHAGPAPGRSELDHAWTAIETLFETSPDPVLLLDGDGHVLASTGPIADIGPEHLRGKRLADLVDDGVRATLEVAVGDAVSPGLVHTLDVPVRGRGGRIAWYACAVFPVRGDRHVGAVLVTTREITARRREEERLRRSERLMMDTQDVAHLGTWEWDPSEPHAVWSPELYHIYGLDPATHTPSYQDYLTRVHPDDRKRVQEATERVFRDHEPYSHDERIIRTDGEMRYLHTWAEAVLDDEGELERLLGVCLDITDRKVAELAVEEHVRELERVNADLEQFAYISSHDLQEPLRMVSSYAQLLARRYDGQLDETADEYIVFVREGADRLHRLIGDFHDYARVSQPHEHEGDVDLGVITDAAIAALSDEAEAAGAVITRDELPVVRGVAGHFGVLMANLLDNAIKFHGDEPPRVHVGAEREGDKWTVSVSDNGLGVDPAYAARIFGIFQRLHHRADYPGTGIGLAICRRVVEGHGGEIHLEPNPEGKGSVVRFTIPVRGAPRDAARPRATPRR